MKFYYESETQTVISEAQIEALYRATEAHIEYPIFSDYIFHALWFNNGSLKPVEVKIAEMEAQIDSLMEANTDGFYTEQIQEQKALCESYKAILKKGDVE